MTTFAYPNQRFTTNLGLSLFGMDEVLADNMNLIDAAYGAGSSINVNGTLVSDPNLNNTTPAAPAGKSNVTWQVDIHGNISAYATTSGPSSAAWATLTGDLTETQVIPFDGPTVGTSDTGVSRNIPAGISIGNGTAADFSGSVLATYISLGVYSGGGQGHMGQINGITFDGTGLLPPSPPYGTASLDVGVFYTSSPHNQSIMGINSAIMAQGTTHNVFALNGQLASPALYTGNITAGWYCVYGEVDHNGSGRMQEGIGVQGQNYQQGAGFQTRGIGGYFESCSGFYSTSTGGIDQNYGGWFKSGGMSGTIASDVTLYIDVPYTGATFTSNPHKGLVIADQTAGGILTTPFAIQVQGSGSYCDFGQNTITFNNTNAGISYKALATIAIGDGNIGAVNGTLELANIILSGTLTDASSSVGTAGQLLSSTHTGTAWVSASGLGVAWSSITNAAADLTLANGAFNTTIGGTGFFKVGGIMNSVTGYQVNGAATSGHVLRGNGTNFVDAQLAYSDLSGTPTVNTWAGLTGTLSNGQVIPYGDSGISRLGAASLAIGNGTAGDTSGTVSANTIISPSNGSVQVKAGNLYGAVLQYNTGLVLYQGNWVSFTASGTLNTGIDTYVARLAAGVIGIGTTGSGTSSTGTLLATTYGFGATNTAATSADTGISRLSAASLAIGNGTAGNTTGNLSLNRISKSGADFAGQATVTAGGTTVAVAFGANYAGTGQPVVVLTPTSDPLALGVPVGYWVTYSGGAGAWTGFTVNIQTALAGNVTFNYIVVGVA